MKRSFYALFNQLVSILCVCIIATTLTGIVLGLSDRLFPLPAVVTNGLMAIHHGAFLGATLSPIYVLFIGIGVFFIALKTVVGGRYNSLFQLTQPSLVNICWVVALILIIPIILCVETGVAYRLGTDWFGISQSQTALFLAVHSGSSLETMLGVSHILVMGLGLIALAILGWKRVDRPHKQKPFQRNTNPKFDKADRAKNSVPSSVDRNRSRKIELATVIYSIIFVGLLYWLALGTVVAVATMVIVCIVSTIVLWKKFVAVWQRHKAKPTKLDEQEAESITILKAIPDSMLRMTQDGICLSYMPAKEASCFVLDGDIINKHINEFMALEIAQGIMEAAQRSLQTGKTQLFQFPIHIDNIEKFHEARITNIGAAEVLILVREVDPQKIVIVEKSPQVRDDIPIELFTEARLREVLEAISIEQDRRNQILIFLAIDDSEFINDNFDNTRELRQQTAILINSFFPFTTIFSLEDNNLVFLIGDSNVEEVSALVDELHRHLLEFFFAWKDDSNLVEFKLGLLEIDPYNLDTTSPSSFANAIVDAAKASCQMAKQKVNLKTFW